MIKPKIEIELYEYSELKTIPQEKAFNEHYEFLCYADEDFHTTEDIRFYVENSININKYLYFKDGSIADIIEYTGKHKKTGIKELNFQDKVYILEDKTINNQKPYIVRDTL